MVDLEKVGNEITSNPNNLNNYISTELRDSIDNLHAQFVNRSKSMDLADLKDAGQLMNVIPTVRFIATLKSVEDDILSAQMDRRFISGLLQAYARIGEELDLKIVQAIDSLGNKIPLIFDQMVDGGFELFSRFGWYFYPGAQDLKRNKYIVYTNIWVAIIRYSHVVIAASCAFLLGYNATYKAIPFISDFELSFVFKVLLTSGIIWSTIVAFIPEFVYSAFSQNILAKAIRSLFVGSSSNASSEEINSDYNRLLELHKNIISIRNDLRLNMKEMMSLSKGGHFQTFYWSRITFDEFTDAITRKDTLTYKDRNVLVMMLGLGNTLPLIKDKYFLTSITPMVWNRFGWGLLAASIVTILSNVFILQAIAKLPLKAIFAI